MPRQLPAAPYFRTHLIAHSLPPYVQAKDGVPVAHQYLVHGGRLLEDSSSLAACGLEAGSTVHQSSRLLGGKPVKVRQLAGA